MADEKLDDISDMQKNVVLKEKKIIFFVVFPMKWSDTQHDIP